MTGALLNFQVVRSRFALAFYFESLTRKRYHFYVFDTWRLFLHKPRDPKQHNKVEKHGERRGGQKTPLGYLVFSRPGGSVSRWGIGTALRGCKPGACPPAWASPGLAIAVWAPAAVGAEAAGLGEAVVQHLCRPDSSHFVLVIIESTCNHSLSPFLTFLHGYTQC